MQKVRPTAAAVLDLVDTGAQSYCLLPRQKVMWLPLPKQEARFKSAPPYGVWKPTLKENQGEVVYHLHLPKGASWSGSGVTEIHVMWPPHKIGQVDKRMLEGRVMRQ